MQVILDTDSAGGLCDILGLKVERIFALLSPLVRNLGRGASPVPSSGYDHAYQA